MAPFTRPFFRDPAAFTAGCVMLVLVVAAWWFNRTPPYPAADCPLLADRVRVCAASDMARFTRTGPLAREEESFSLRDGRIELEGARNETLAFQLVLRTGDDSAPRVAIRPGSWQRRGAREGAAGPALPPRSGSSESVSSRAASSAGLASDSSFPQSVYLAHYHWVQAGGYTWGPKTEVLDWPDAYPDALVPSRAPCEPARQLFDAIALPGSPGTNQAVWFDTWIPPETPPGTYRQRIVLSLDGAQLDLALDLTVHAARLPGRPDLVAMGEIYAPWRTEGIDSDLRDPAWQAMSRCYQQMAHRHRMVFLERFEKGLDEAQWPAYLDTFGAALSGELFTPAYGYRGPGEGEPVQVWRPPWPQRVDVTIRSPATEAQLDRYRTLARDWSARVAEHGWYRTRHFAYLLDEVDGPPLPGETAQAHRSRLMLAREERIRLQRAIDEGGDGQSLDLLWTSHSNPSQWAGDPPLDLRGVVRLWAPNAHAADPGFLAARMAAGETAWFYHSGHPAVGAHGINASGIEMRSWGVIAARYGIQGQFMWAVNLGDPDRPYAYPSWKRGDDRFGNGLIVYPGHALDQIGYEKAPGPIPSMRIKAWRRGLQDAQLYQLARERDPARAEALIARLVPRALAEGQGRAAWSRLPADWIRFHRELLRLASLPG